MVWEAWREAGKEEGTRVRDGLRLSVTEALITLGQWVLWMKGLMRRAGKTGDGVASLP